MRERIIAHGGRLVRLGRSASGSGGEQPVSEGANRARRSILRRVASQRCRSAPRCPRCRVGATSTDLLTTQSLTPIVSPNASQRAAPFEMKPQAGAPVLGANFFNRDAELRLLEAKVRAGMHILLAGQRRMGKTSLARELGRRLQADGWAFLFSSWTWKTPPRHRMSSATSPRPRTPSLAFRRA